MLQPLSGCSFWVGFRREGRGIFPSFGSFKSRERIQGFSALMNEVLRPFLRKFVLGLFDDILAYSRTEEEHLRDSRVVLLTAVKGSSLFANRKKCCFGQRQPEYLGHLIFAEGVLGYPKKQEVMSV